MKQRKGKKGRKSIEKPFNNGTMTNSGFFGMIRSALRQKSRWWKAISECKRLAKRKSQSNNKKLKFEYQCKICTNWFPEKEISVDHIVEAGRLSSFEDLPGFTKRLFCEVDGLQVLCDECHQKKTNEYKIRMKDEKERTEKQL